MNKLVVVLAPLVALLVSACGRADVKPVSMPAADPPPAASACMRGRAFVVVRHAEKASTDKDTPLSERGRARAQVLATMLGGAGVTRLVATQFKRTQETLAPLAARLSLPVDVRDAATTSDLVAELRGAPDGSVIVVASHSNVIPRIVEDLAGAKLRGVAGDMLPEDDYSRVIVITEPCGARQPYVLELSSGD